MSDVSFIIQAYTRDCNARLDAGLYHWPKLEKAKQLRRALRREFTNITAQIDLDRDPVALVVEYPLTVKTVPDASAELRSVFDRIVTTVERVSGDTQHIHIFIQGSVRAGLQEAGIDANLFAHIAEPS